MRPMWSPSRTAIGASGAGGRSTAMPGSARRKLFTQLTFREEPNDLPERKRDPDHEHADDQRIQPWIGEESRPDLPVENEDDQCARMRNTRHPHQKNPR